MCLETRLVSNSWSFRLRLLHAGTTGTCYHTGIFHPFAAVFCLLACFCCLSVGSFFFFFAIDETGSSFIFLMRASTSRVQPRRVSPIPLHWKPHPFPHTSFLKSRCHWCSKLSSQHARHPSVSLATAVRGQRTEVCEDSLREALPPKQNQTQF